MKALCLQGGGAKGAFQAGVLKALTQKGCRFDCVVGTSVGSINAAMYALGKVDELYDLWKELDFADVLPLERKGEGQNLTIRSIAATAIEAFRSGVDTSKIRAIIEKHVDEDALRASPIRFGLVTAKGSFTKPVLCELFIEDIPKGQLVDFIMASSALPFFKKVEIDGVRYIDGGILDNLPIRMLANAGYTDVTAVRLGGNLHYEDEEKGLKVTYIDPSESVGHTINFSNFSITHDLNLGYYDVLRLYDGLYGKKYYIKPFGKLRLRFWLWKHRRFVNKAIAYTGVKFCASFREKTAVLTAFLAEKLKCKDATLVEIWTRFVEYVATLGSLERWKVYRFTDFADAAAKKEFDLKKQSDETEDLLAIARLLKEEITNGK